eukprot:m.143543 g.143543  ORF g.143543 m.143543 type:complete len:59 (-) comp13207_c0_seq10:616-792(-)
MLKVCQSFFVDPQVPLSHRCFQSIHNTFGLGMLCRVLSLSSSSASNRICAISSSNIRR